MESNPTSLATALLARRGAPESPGPALVELLGRLLTSAEARWPGMSACPELFMKHLAGVIPDGVEVESALARLKFDDLYLAFHCCQGDPAAVAAFEDAFLSSIEVVLARVSSPPAQIDEIKQILRERLLVGGEGREPGLASYAGRGPLRSFIRISSLREVYRAAAQQKRFIDEDDDRLVRLAAPEDDPELSYLKEHYRQRFRDAFSRVMAGLTPRRRNLLKHYYLDGMTIDQIGALYDIHRATAARELGRIRRHLAEGTREEMMAGLEVGPGECESIIRLIESRMDISIGSFLERSTD